MFPHSNKWTITFENRHDFEDMTGPHIHEMVIDVGHSDMILIFDDKDNFEIIKGSIESNRITQVIYDEDLGE